MASFIEEYVAICRNFNVSDLATRRNVQQLIVPRIREIRADLTAALWEARRMRCAIPRDDRRAFIKESQQCRASARAALARIRIYEAKGLA